MRLARPAEAQNSPNALRILAMRYLKKDRDGAVIETPEGMF